MKKAATKLSGAKKTLEAKPAKKVEGKVVNAEGKALKEPESLERMNKGGHSGWEEGP